MYGVCVCACGSAAYLLVETKLFIISRVVEVIEQIFSIVDIHFPHLEWTVALSTPFLCERETVRLPPLGHLLTY